MTDPSLLAQIAALQQQLAQRSRSLADAEARYNAVFNSALSPMSICTTDGVILDVNQAALRAIGLPIEAFVGKHLWESPWFAENPAEAVSRAGDILGMDIKGHTVHRVLLAPAADIAEEYYFSFLVDRADRRYLCIASTEGGVEIEVTAHEKPEAVAKVAIDPLVGVAAFEGHHDPEQRLGREEAIRVFTLGSARLAHQEDKKGSLEPGKHADFAVYDVDPLGSEELAGVRQVLTVSLGRDVYAA